MIFANRTVAGTLLGIRIRTQRIVNDPVVIGVPRGGAITGSAVAYELEAPFDVVVTERIPAPANPSFSVATVDEDGRLVTMGANLPPPVHVEMDELASQVAGAQQRARRRAARYRLGGEHEPLEGRDVVIADDGILTGLSACAVALYARAHGATNIVIAAPVASAQAVAQLEHAADRVIVLDMPQPLTSIAEHYRHFSPVPDAAVRAVLHHAIEPRLAGRGSEITREGV